MNLRLLPQKTKAVFFFILLIQTRNRSLSSIFSFLFSTFNGLNISGSFTPPVHTPLQPRQLVDPLADLMKDPGEHARRGHAILAYSKFEQVLGKKRNKKNKQEETQTKKKGKGFTSKRGERMKGKTINEKKNEKETKNSQFF